jgi:hypothetical protein
MGQRKQIVVGVDVIKLWNYIKAKLCKHHDWIDEFKDMKNLKDFVKMLLEWKCSIEDFIYSWLLFNKPYLKGGLYSIKLIC